MSIIDPPKDKEEMWKRRARRALGRKTRRISRSNMIQV